MKKILASVLALSLCGMLALYVNAKSGRESTLLPPQEVKIMYASEEYGYALKDLAGIVRWKILPDGQQAFYNSSGVTIWTKDVNGFETTIKQDAVVLNTVTQFSSWSYAPTAGQSYYQTEAGKRYIVDPWAINISHGKFAGAGSFTGVSLILPDATANSEGTVRIEYASTGTSGWLSNNPAMVTHGTTIVSVWPYAGSAATYYGAAASKPQSLLSIYSTAGVMTGITAYSGNSYFELNRLGESVEYALYSGSFVSAYPIRRNVTN